MRSPILRVLIVEVRISQFVGISQQTESYIVLALKDGKDVPSDENMLTPL
jgi:hypothetical protein